MARKNAVIEVEPSLVEVQGKTLFDRVSNYLTDRDWSFSSNAEQGYCSFGLRLRDGTVRVLVDAAEGGGWSRMLVYATYPTFVPEPRRPAVTEALARINYTTAVGSFEMDLNDGEVRVRTVQEGDCLIGEPMIDRSVRRSVDLADQYQAAILAIAFGNASPKDILAMGSQSDGATLQ